jgi:hypothetical protein
MRLNISGAHVQVTLRTDVGGRESQMPPAFASLYSPSDRIDITFRPPLRLLRLMNALTGKAKSR